MVNEPSHSLDSLDRGALLSLVSLVVKWGTVAANLRREIEALEIAEKEARDKWVKARETFALYGFEEAGDAAWERIREMVGPEMWHGAIEKGTLQAALVPRERPTLLPYNVASATDAATSRPDEKGKPTPPLTSTPGTPLVKDVILTQLRTAFPKGLKAAEIRGVIENIYERHLHEKTVGMTLYRLLKEGLVSRTGRNWFFVPPSEEQENPGVDTPGPDWLT